MNYLPVVRRTIKRLRTIKSLLLPFLNVIFIVRLCNSRRQNPLTHRSPQSSTQCHPSSQASLSFPTRTSANCTAASSRVLISCVRAQHFLRWVAFFQGFIVENVQIYSTNSCSDSAGLNELITFSFATPSYQASRTCSSSVTFYQLKAKLVSWTRVFSTCLVCDYACHGAVDGSGTSFWKGILYIIHSPLHPFIACIYSLANHLWYFAGFTYILLIYIYWSYRTRRLKHTHRIKPEANVNRRERVIPHLSGQGLNC